MTSQIKNHSLQLGLPLDIVIVFTGTSRYYSVIAENSARM